MKTVKIITIDDEDAFLRIFSDLMNRYKSEYDV